MRFRVCAALLLLCLPTMATAQLIGMHCPRCNIVFAGSVAKKQSFGMCLECSAGCPHEKSAIPDRPDDSTREQTVRSPPAPSICGLLTPPPKVLASAEQMPVTLSVDAELVGDLSRRYPIAATLLAVMASREGAPNIFDAGTVRMGMRHQPHAGTASAFLERGDAALQAPFLTELPLFEQVLVEVRGERLASGDIEWWVLSSLETERGTRVLEGPVRIVLTDSGERAAAAVGNMGLMAQVMTVATVE